MRGQVKYFDYFDLIDCSSSVVSLAVAAGGTLVGAGSDRESKLVKSAEQARNHDKNGDWSVRSFHQDG